ncbi:major facilitator superfamily domain-containing protein [Pisolithus albus]|nr:major facilitator superfamily domain-containing protein [Pisolithus albus]
MATERDPLLPNTGRTDTRLSAAVGPLDTSRSTRYAILAGLWSATFLSVSAVSLIPSISSEFNKSNEASWLGTSYLLAVCTFTPLYGRLCNVMGRRGANQLAVFVACLGTVACGFSGNMEMLVVARFVSFISTASLVSVSPIRNSNDTSRIIMSDMYSMRSRGLAQGFSSLFSGLGMGLGGPVGGLVNDLFGWRWAFIMQIPLFALSLTLTTLQSALRNSDVLKRIDWGGSITLLIAIGSFLVFLSMKFSEDLSWSDPLVVASIILGIAFMAAFILVELCVSPEPVLASALLRQKVPVIVGVSNFLVAMCNFSVMYFFPMWFQTVVLTNASTAGLHLLPNSMAMSCGSLFAGYMMHRTGRYKMINILFGFSPFVGCLLITFIRENSGPLQSWLSIIPLGFGNAVVLQTTLDNLMAVGTGFSQVFRGLGQVSGVAVSSALFQSKLDCELRKRIYGPDATEIINSIRRSATLVASLSPDLQRAARDSYAVAIRDVFIFAACSTLTAYIVRLQLPDKSLEHGPPRKLTTPIGQDMGGTPTIPSKAYRTSVREDAIIHHDASVCR